MKNLTILLIISISTLFAQPLWEHRFGMGMGVGIAPGAFGRVLGYGVSMEGELQYQLWRGPVGLVVGFQSEYCLPTSFLLNRAYPAADDASLSNPVLSIPAGWVGFTGRLPLRMLGDTISLCPTAGAIFPHSRDTLSQFFSYYSGTISGIQPQSLVYQVNNVSSGWSLGLSGEYSISASWSWYLSWKTQSTVWNTTVQGRWYTAGDTPVSPWQATSVAQTVPYVFTRVNHLITTGLMLRL